MGNEQTGPEKDKWFAITEAISHTEDVTLGSGMARWMAKDPRRLAFHMSHYKFASKLIGRGKRVLDINCGEGLGTWLLALECGFAKGMDSDGIAVETARRNWRDDRIEFAVPDSAVNPQNAAVVPVEAWNAVVAFDALDRLPSGGSRDFLASLAGNLAHDGIAIVGTPSLESRRYAAAGQTVGSGEGFTYEKLEAEMQAHFHHVFMFTWNDEVMQLGFPRMAEYLVAVGCRKRA